ncbi:MAG: NAD(P)/FAD-dependent oxidoreductase [Minisyncoccia bacterium]
MYDSIIIGAGPAGISSAIYLKRRGLNFLIISENIGGELNFIYEIKNYPGFKEITGIDLSKRFYEHLKSYDIEPVIDNVISLEKRENFFVLTKKNKYESKTIIIASGAKPKKLNLPGEEKFLNKGISYCSVCDLPLFNNKNVAIIGGGSSSVTAGLMASKICKRVYIITNKDSLSCEKVLAEELERKDNVEIIKDAIVKGFYGDDFLRGLKYLDKYNNEKDLKIDGVFIHIGLMPCSDFVPESWGIKNERGEIIIDKYCKTKIDGVFAAGDITDLPYNQIGIAVGQGIISALSAIEYLNRLK